MEPCRHGSDVDKCEMDFKERGYVIYRCIKAKLGAVLYYLFLLYPIRRNRIAVTNYQGKQGYGCNLKAIVEQVVATYGIDTKYEIVWLVNDTEREFPSFIKKVKNNYINRAFYLSTSGIWLDNYRKPFEVRKLRKQLYINTWHGMMGFKTVGKLRGTEFPKIAELVSRNDSQMVDVFLSNSNWVDNVIKQAFLYDGRIIRTGSPRCDRFFNNSPEEREEVLKKNGLDVGYKYVIYAPTARLYNQAIHIRPDEYLLPFRPENVCIELGKRFGGKWKVLYRNHPLAAVNKDAQSDYMIDISKWGDLYEILSYCDVFISDYSSSTFDAANRRIPIFLIMDDLENYTTKRGLLWDIEEIPFPVAKKEQELLKNISEFNETKYAERLEVVFKSVELLEDGQASERVLKEIDEWFERS